MNKLGFYKIISVYALFTNWLTVALAPDENGKVVVTISEIISLVEGICGLIGVKLEINTED